MKITEFTRDRQVIELGAPGAVAGAMASAVKGAAGGGGAPAAPGAPAPAPTMGGGAQDPQQLQKMAAASAMQMAERKKQIQDDIKAKQQEIQDLQKELATIK
jgi:hypothetical protein